MFFFKREKAISCKWRWGNLVAVTSRRFRSPPVCSHDGRVTLLRPLRLVLYLLCRCLLAAYKSRRFRRGLSASCVGHRVTGCLAPLTAMFYVRVSAAGRAGWRTRLPLRGGPGSECFRPSLRPLVPSVRHVYSAATVFESILERPSGNEGRR